MLKSFKTEINPTAEQKIRINKTIGTCRYIYNFYIDYNKAQHDKGKKFMTDEQFILIWIGLMKKVLKLCIMELGIFPEQFSEKYIFIKPYNNHLIVLNYIPTEIALEKIKKKITNFLPLEEKILFENYLDYYNYGILYFNSFQEIFDKKSVYLK